MKCNERYDEQEDKLIGRHSPEPVNQCIDKKKVQNDRDVMAVSCRAKISLLLLVFINLINYMDRLTIAGETLFVSCIFSVSKHCRN